MKHSGHSISFNLNKCAMNDSQNTLMKVYKICGWKCFKICRHDVITVQSFSKAVIRWGCLYDKSLKSSDIETIVGRVVSEAVFKWCRNLRHPATNRFTFWKCDREPSKRLKKHSLGELNPYTKDSFDPEVVQVYKLSNLNTNNMLHA
jgi:hypothetical protein